MPRRFGRYESLVRERTYGVRQLSTANLLKEWHKLVQCWPMRECLTTLNEFIVIKYCLELRWIGNNARITHFLKKIINLSKSALYACIATYWDSSIKKILLALFTNMWQDWLSQTLTNNIYLINCWTKVNITTRSIIKKYFKKPIYLSCRR